MRFSELSDEELALRARTTPREAFEVLFERHRGPLYNFILRQGVAEGRAEDLFQTTVLKAYRALSSFREEARFKTWLYTIAVNVVMDELRGQQRRGRAGELRDTVPSLALESAERSEQLARVREALGDLPPHHRRLFTLVRFQGFSIAEAAAVTGLTPQAAKVTLFRTQKKIGEMLSTAKETIR
jgi:RNA polymerase sigma-70 factor (ECF subfamily)